MGVSGPQVAAIAFGILVAFLLVGVLFSALAWRLMQRAGNRPPVSEFGEVYRPVVTRAAIIGFIAAAFFVIAAVAL